MRRITYEYKTFKAGRVYYKDQLAGLISETETGYRFAYDHNYLQNGGKLISVSLPLRPEPYESPRLFSFFDGLLPEGFRLFPGVALSISSPTFSFLSLSTASEF